MRLTLYGIIWQDAKLNFSFYEDTSLVKLTTHIPDTPNFIKPYNNKYFWVKNHNIAQPDSGKAAKVIIEIMVYKFKSTREPNKGEFVSGCYLKLINLEYV